MTDRPATLGQTRFYLLDQREGGSARTLVKRITVHGAVDPTRLLRAVAAVLAAQPSLRVSLRPDAEGALRQRVHTVAEVPVRYTAAGGGTDEEVAAHAAAVAREESRRAVRHEGAPLCRVAVLAGERRAECVFTVHHAVFDEESSAILLRALSTAYAEDRMPDDSPGTEPEPPGAGAGAETQTGTGETVAGLEAFWSAQLDGAPLDTRLPVLTTPGDGDTAANRRRRSFPVPAPLTERVRRTARATGATAFMQLLAALALTLGYYTDRDDIVVSTVAAGHDEARRDTIGCLQNTLPIRIRLADADTAGLLDRTLDALSDALDHAALPVERILQLARAGRAADHQPFAGVLCTQVHSVAPAEAAGLRWELRDVLSADIEYPLSVALGHDPGGALRLDLGHREGSVSDTRIESFARHLLRAWEALTDVEPRPLDAIRLLDTAEVALLRELGSGPTPAGDGLGTVVAAFAAQAAATPARTAVRAGDAALSYAELDRRSQDLARALGQAGAGHGTRVGIALPRTPDLVVAVLAVLRAGAAYVPLDLDDPPRRLRELADDCALAAIVTDPGSRPGAVVPAVPVLRADVRPADPGTPLHGPRPDDTAYILYTSGSTGPPKGVTVGHRNLTALLDSFHTLIGTPPEAVVAGTAVTFDISALEILWPLTAGSTVHLTTHRAAALTAAPPGALYQCTPTVAGMLLADPAGRGFLSRLAVLLVGGETLPRDVGERLAALVPGQVWNCYGPTETTVWSTSWRVRGGEPVRIGAPLAGERCYITDTRGRPLPPGCPGPLRIAGAGVAQGYWRRPELTERRFAPLPELGEDRAYDTGDIAVLDEGGDFRFLERADAQTKVLGRRVEPEEVEAALRAHPGVADAAVILAGTGITAFLVPAGPQDEAPATAEVRAHVAGLLPPVLVPHTYHSVPALPQLPSGKLDRARLPALAPPAAPATPTGSGAAADVATVWSRVLGCPVADRDAGFFALGGSSAQLLQVLAALRDTYPGLRVADLFQYPTVRSLADHLAPGPAPLGPAPTPADEGRGRARASAVAAWGAARRNRPERQEQT